MDGGRDRRFFASFTSNDGLAKEVFCLQKLGKGIVDDMAVLVAAAGVIGALYPPAFAWAGHYVSWLLGLVMFGMGMTLSVEDFRRVFARPRYVAIGVFAQFLIMPLVAYALVRVFHLPPELAIGVILLGTCPGGTASNVISYLARGDVALSVSMTMTTTLLAPVVTPALTYLLAGAYIEVSFSSMMLSIAEMVLLPVLLGLLVHHYFEPVSRRIMPVMPVFSVLCIVTLVGCVVALSSTKLLTVGPLMAVLVVLHNAFGLALGYGLAKCFGMESRGARTVSIEVGMQNSGLAVSLALLYFNPAAAIPGAIFSVWHNISGSLFANFWVRRDEKKEKKEVVYE